MPLIVGGSALPTDKPIIGASGEIHKVVAKNGDVIWEMKTGINKDDFVFFKGTSPSWYMHNSGGKTYILVADHTPRYSVLQLGADEVFEHNAVQIVKGEEYSSDVFEIGLKLRKGHWGNEVSIGKGTYDIFAEIDFNGSNKGEGNGLKGNVALGVNNDPLIVSKTYIHATVGGNMDTEILQVYMCTNALGKFKKWIVD